MTEKYRYYGMTWVFPTYVKMHGYRYKFGGITDLVNFHVNREEAKYSGKSMVVRVFRKKNRRGKEFTIHIQYWRDTGKPKKSKPFDWNDPENKYRYNMGGGVQRRP